MKTVNELENMIEGDVLKELRNWSIEQLKAARAQQERRDFKARQHHDEETSAAAMFLQVCIDRALDERRVS